MSETLQLPRIKRLPSSLANQIAAGEVIERPASIVKELMENCLDAGATRIVVEISKAGSQLIRVTDNGHGIHPEDLQLALQRHATAKLNSHSDLTAIHSLGFRGEALSSISSVANFTMTSRIASMDQATRLMIDPQTAKSELRPAAHPVGTTVEVSNLFHNTPARKKFLRSERTEFLHIQETARRLALSRFNFTLELGHNENKVFSCRAVTTDLNPRVAGVMGQAFIRKAIALEHDVSDMQLWGWLGVGDLARSTTDRQYLYLNGRIIHDKRLNHAVRVACEDHIATGRFPSYVLHLQMDVAAADINVHPTKHEVRFRHARDVHDFVYAALCTSLQEDQNLYADYQAGSDEKSESGSLINEGALYPRRHNIVGELRLSYGELYGGRQTELTDDMPALGQVLLQISQNFILTQRGDELFLVNIDAAQKYIARTRLDSVQTGETIKGRPLLVPVSYAITQSQESTLSSIASLIEDYALQVEMSGPGTCRLRTIPNLLENADFSILVNDILDLNISGLSTTEIRQCLVEIMVDHVCDIPSPSLSDAELTTLLRQLEKSGVNVSLKRYPPIWTCVEAEDLQRLINRDE